MKKRNPEIPFENLSTGYNGIVEYHNNLVQVRFTVAGLSVAADGFLASAFFQTGSPDLSRILIATLGLILTFICGMLELRTLQLLMKLLKAGYMLEKAMELGADQGVFSVLMQSQIVPRFLKKLSNAPSDQESRFVFSHSVMFWLLYICIFIFWMIMFALALLNIV
ncbi:MAG: hypothetical protein J0M11_00760 [Anaerolineae bacterium]|nr:hypothetical protein [Anaerolineae bacterium]